MLFGHQNDTAQTGAPSTAPSVDASQAATVSSVNPLAVDPATGVSLPAATADTVASIDPTQDEPSVLDQPSAPSYSTPSVFASDPAPTSPFGSDQASTLNSSDTTPQILSSPVATPPVADSAPTAPSTPSDIVDTPSQPGSIAQLRLTSAPTNTPTSSADDLLAIKQQALSQLGPLVGQLEQSPEEKFRTAMMLIQSTDNAALLKDAYDAAQSISDEKGRAQALLDIVNEINYFTQQASSSSQAEQ